jgi:nucleotide sugar dehydrogenase
LKQVLGLVSKLAAQYQEGSDKMLGLIGNGFVGSAIYENLKSHYEFAIYDKKPTLANRNSIKEVIEEAEVVFVALPTPMYNSGKCDLTFIFDAMKEIYDNYNNNIIILKSTVVPGTCDEIKKRFPNMRIVFSPEFLTEANHIEDFRNCNRMIFGGLREDTAACVNLVQPIFEDKHYFTTDWKTAETVKYFINIFLATKISFANEMKQICDLVGVEYNSIARLALCDQRIGRTHLQVPGNDGHYGFGGKCFPKDLNAMIHLCLTAGFEPVILKSVWNKNLDIREEHDWMNIEGAVSCAKRE